MAQFVYVDETGSDGSGKRSDAMLRVVAVLVPDASVTAVSDHLREIAQSTLGRVVEFHGHEMWGRRGPWEGIAHDLVIRAYEACLSCLEPLNIRVAHSAIHKSRLHDRYSGRFDHSAYRLGLQFLLEKVDALGGLNVVVADRKHGDEREAMRMLAEIRESGLGEVPSLRRLKHVIDSLHYVDSRDNSGVQLADLVAYVIQRWHRDSDTHPAARAAMARLHDMVLDRVVTHRQPWPS